MKHLVPVRSAVVATGLLAALASIPAAHATPAPSSAAATEAPSASPATGAPKPATSEPPTAEPSTAPGGKESATPSPVPSAGDATEAPSPAPADGTEAPSAAPADDELAHTGSSNTGTAVMGAGAVVLVAGGAGALFAVRRRSHR
ncbi:LAETG motif-containing sortase-dependent surface protein [Streptomyces sp. NPDC057694]|uniref:LAETG motif-containing sortase-dependent surface protein n=1 Tax=Streptomyces sp. NPDC057694 TaxID=3346216 RepID=UPI00369CB937